MTDLVCYQIFDVDRNCSETDCRSIKLFSGLRFLSQGFEEVFRRHIVNCKKLHQGFQGNVRPAVLDAPVLHPGEFVVERKRFIAFIALLFPQFLELFPDPNDQIFQDFLFFHVESWKYVYLIVTPMLIHHIWYIYLAYRHFLRLGNCYP